MSITIFVGLLLMLSATLDSAVLSIDTVRSSFTTLSMLREVNVGDFLTRVEVVGIFTWTLGGFLKLSLCYWVLSLGLAEFLGLPDYRSLVFPLGIIMVSLSILLFESFAAMIENNSIIYPVFALPLQVLIPSFLLLVAVFKSKKQGSRSNTGDGTEVLQ
jgi:spore germination protein KB